jgi:uncharacterized membrane protein
MWPGLVGLARSNDGVLVLRHAVEDFVPSGACVVEVLGPASPAVERRLRRMFALGRERTIQQDPAFAVRILVDSAIRALSPAVNDPTTAVHVLNYIEDLLRQIGRCDLAGVGQLRDGNGRVRFLVPTRRWEDDLELGLTEVRGYGATSVQVTRRLRSLLVELRTVGTAGAPRRGRRRAVQAGRDRRGGLPRRSRPGGRKRKRPSGIGGPTEPRPFGYAGGFGPLGALEHHLTPPSAGPRAGGW